MSKKSLLYGCFFLSGVAGLGYEMLWTRMLAVGLGHEVVSMLAVVSAFFCGIALGAQLFDRLVSSSRTPVRWYAGFELVIGGWALLLAVFLPEIGSTMSGLIGLEPSPLRHWLMAFSCTFCLLLPATAAMGGTLPAMDRIFMQFNQGSAVAGLYSANTFGAMTGTLAVTFLILPALGMTGASLLLAMANAVVGVGMLLAARSRIRPNPSGETDSPELASRPYRRLSCILFGTGLLGIGFEVVMVRVLSQILANTVFTFALLLSVFLFGTAAGAAFYQRCGRRFDFERTLVVLLAMTSLTCAGSVLLLRFADGLFAWTSHLLGGGFACALLAEALLAMAFFFLPTVAMGATFGHLAQSFRRPDGGVGRALCLNAIGGAVAPLLFGLGLLPVLGMQPVLLLIATGYLVLLPKLPRGGLAVSLAAATVMVLVLASFSIVRFVSMPAGDTLISHRDGVMASVSVVRDQRQNYYLKVNNNFQMGGTSSVYSDSRQAQLPLLLHAEPHSALFLGLGTGMTFASTANYPGLEADGVELIPEVIEAMPFFAGPGRDISAAGNLHVIEADARRYVSVTDKSYDVIVADLFHPARDGAGSLYTVEHFAAIRNILNQEGLFCQWLPLYQLDFEMLKVITASFLDVFPHAQAYLAHYSLQAPIIGLVGSVKPLRYPEKWFRTKLADEVVRSRVLPLKYDSFYSLFGTYLAGDARLRQFSAGERLNTDQNPVVVFEAPRFVYGDSAPADQRLLALLEELSPPDPNDLLANPVTEEDYLAGERLSAYWDARDSFLKTGVAVERTSDIRKLYADVHKPLLDVVRKSIDFSAAYFPLLSIAYELFPVDRDASYQLLTELMGANPMRREAYLLRRKLFEEAAP